MTFISYAQNFEDVLLWRALRSVGPGFYIDVGAADPDVDSVTRALYERGWSGVNIEPVAASARHLEHARVRDVTLQVALGDTAGRTGFSVVRSGPDTGLSTMVDGTLDHLRRDLFEVDRTEVDVLTLAEVCRQHALGPIHLLKIDVEGAERAVLAGADFDAFRPWVVLVEATAPLSTAETHAEWEGILLEARYRFVWFDGLNRFYLAEERTPDLIQHFRVPPNVFDDFVRVADTGLATRYERAEAQRVAADIRARIAEERADGLVLRLARSDTGPAELDHASRQRWDEWLTLRGRLNEVDQARRTAETARARASRRASTLVHRAAQLEVDLLRARTDLAATRTSPSWRVTAPLRWASRLLGRARSTPGRDDAALAVEPSVLAEPGPTVLDTAPASPAVARVFRQPLRTVHQFHSGSATGDAITNAMLLTRDLLRREGYRSDIYVEHRDEALSGELLLAEDLPEHDAYVLLVRHSMGHGMMERLLDLAAPKVLLYHNITPPRYLDHPFLRAAARQGRAQLVEWRPHIAAALADSEYNALELRGLGYDPVQVCTLLVGAADLRARMPPARPKPDRPFTIVFVGRVTESKGQLELIEGFARFVHPFGTASRLILVGRNGGPEDPYLESLWAAIRRHGIDAQVVVTGGVSDAERDRWYAQADLYVSLSHHEGFGVPLVEAMSHGLPILAWPAGAVAATIAGVGELLDDRSPDTVAQRMLDLARDPRRRAAMAEAGRRALARFDHPHHLERLIQALVRAGAAPPPDPTTRDAIAATMGFVITGHVAGTYSLAGVNRALAAAIEAARPGRVRILPVEGTPTDDLSRVPAGERETLVRLAGRPPPATGPEVVISQHYPIYVPPDRGDLPLALVFWEESAVPATMVGELVRFRGVLAPTCFVARVLADSGVPGPVRVLGHAPRLTPFQALAASREARTRADGTPLTFLHVSSCFPRKGVDVLIAGYALAFRREDPVLLVIKGHPNPHNDVPDQIAALLAGDPDAPAIRYIGDDLDEAGLLALYEAADAMVLPTRGEGYNLPAAEAMAAGLPLIVTGFGGHLDFCGPEEARLLEFDFAPSRSHLRSAGSVWAEPSTADLALALREVSEQPDAARSRAERALKRIALETESGALAERLSGIALDLVTAPPAEPMRIAWISPWGVRCGVAEYSRQLVTHLSAGHLAEVVVLSDARPAEPEDALWHGTSPRVRREWQIGDPICIRQIAGAVMREDPHAVVVQHQPGLIAWTSLGALLLDPALAHRVTVVTLHNTHDLADIAEEARQQAVAGLARASRILVHTLADLNRLKRMGLVENVVLFPHGVPLPRPPRPARELKTGDPALIGCYGFLLGPKGIPQLVGALALLRTTWPAARLRLVTAMYPAPESDAVLAACRAATAADGLEGAVEFITGFLPHDESMDLLAECDLIVLPYQVSKEASSAAMRTALAVGVPVAVTPLPLFDEAEDAVARLTGIDPASIAGGIAELLRDRARRAALVAAGQGWLAARRWDDVGRRVTGLLRNLVTAKGA